MRKLFHAEDAVLAAVKRHCEAKGYVKKHGINNFVPYDPVAAFAMAELLVRQVFHHVIAVAPEGHIYGFFLERLGVPVMSVYVDYPPTRCDAVDDLAAIRGWRVLVIEDDVVSGRTLELVADHLRPYKPRDLSLYLGHARYLQHLDNVPPEFCEVYLAEERLDPAERSRHEEAFIDTRW
jgi:hypothetical protein